MGLEAATIISDLVATNPTAGDPKTQGDDHIRLLKAVLLATFPNINAALTVTDEELNFLSGVTSAIQTQISDIQTQITERMRKNTADTVAAVHTLSNGVKIGGTGDTLSVFDIITTNGAFALYSISDSKTASGSNVSAQVVGKHLQGKFTAQFTGSISAATNIYLVNSSGYTWTGYIAGTWYCPLMAKYGLLYYTGGAFYLVNDDYSLFSPGAIYSDPLFVINFSVFLA